MDFEKLISDFAERHGIANLAAEDNAAALDVDGIVITLVTVGDSLSVSADIGEPPAEGRAEFAELMLEANLQAEPLFAKESRRSMLRHSMSRLSRSSTSPKHGGDFSQTSVRSRRLLRMALRKLRSSAQTASCRCSQSQLGQRLLDVWSCNPLFAAECQTEGL